MANFVSSGWASGATVNAYAQDAFGNQTGAAVAGPLTASSAGQVTFTGLADSTKYVASDGTRKVRFQTTAAPASVGVLDWAPNRAYAANTVVRQGGLLWRANADFTAGASFNPANWTAVPTGSYDGLPGILAPSAPAIGPTTSALVANQVYVARFVPVESFTATAISFALSTFSATDDPCDVGIYDAALNRLVSSGATTGKLNAATGAKSVAIAATALTAGTVYYAAFAANSTASLVFGNLGSFGAAQLFGATVPDMIAALKTVSYPLPASLTAMTAAGTAPLLAVKK